MSIRTYGDEVLRRPAMEVDAIDRRVKDECTKMVEEMLRANGVGIAAPQVGISKRIFILDVDERFQVLINPEIVEVSEDAEEIDEACLSLPGISGPVVRKKWVRVRGLDLDGRPVEVEGEGLLARAIQHEMDHLDGILFIDHLSPARRSSLLKELRRQERAEA
ncbi:peptide deformylase [Candidatus Bipolaricaulota bacterium]|nr:peptide deformylase [Candidatus Bipolaricaulota bacterium]